MPQNFIACDLELAVAYHGGGSRTRAGVGEELVSKVAFILRMMP